MKIDTGCLSARVIDVWTARNLDGSSNKSYYSKNFAAIPRSFRFRGCPE